MIYERLVSLFPALHVTEDLEGVEFSVNGKVEGLCVLYLFEIIEETADLKGAQIARFAKSIRARNATKGYLIHSHSIKTKHRRMDLAKGIEFIRFNNFVLDDFTLEPEVAVKYFNPSLRNAEITQRIHLNNDMLLNPPKKLIIRREDEGIISLDRGNTQIKIADYIVQKYLERKPNIIVGQKLDLRDEQIYLRVNDVWLLTDITVLFKWRKPAYLIFLKASEVSQYQNQWKGKPASKDFQLKRFQLPPQERCIIVGNPHTMPVHTNLLYEGKYVLPENMPEWIPGNLSYSED